MQAESGRARLTLVIPNLLGALRQLPHFLERAWHISATAQKNANR